MATTVHKIYNYQCIADLDASGNPLRSYTWGSGIDNLLAMTVFLPDSTNTYYAIKDHLGTIHALVNEQGQVAVSFGYDAWGVLKNSSFSTQHSSLELRYLFQGREYSAATGLYNFRARWYDPVAGRWLSNDPIGISGGLNLYEFCGNNPVNYVDPDGLSTIEITITGGKIFVLNDPDIFDFISFIKAQENGTITSLSIFDHGTRFSMDIDGEGTGLVWDGKEKIMIETTDCTFSEVIGPKIADGCKILLSGCNTAREWPWKGGQENIARQLSREIPSSVVVGNRGAAIGNQLQPFWSDKPWVRFGKTRNVGFHRPYIGGSKK